MLYGDLCTEDSRIISIGATPANFKADRIVDCRGGVLMSGFCNAHAHAAMSLFRGVADDLNLDDWLHGKIFPLEKNLTPEDVYWGTLLQIAEYVRGGITCFADMYFYPESIAAAALNSGLGLALCSTVSDAFQGDPIQYIDRNYRLFSSMSDRVRYFPGIHAEYTTSEKLIEQVADFAAECESPTYTHLSETLNEVGGCTVRHNGLTPPQYLHKLGFFDNGGCAAHCVYVDKDDVSLLSQSGVIPVINAGSNLKLASGVAPVVSMLERDMHPALGTDGVASNNAASMFREMYLFACLQKERMKDASAVSAMQAIRAATEDGYRALGFDGGVLRVNGFADLVLIDTDLPNMQPSAELPSSLVYSCGCENVRMTVASGKIVYEAGHFHIGEDISKIYKECNARKKRLCAAL